MMTAFAITHPVATIARGVENLVLTGENSKSWLVQGACAVLSRVVSLTAFPVFLLLELTFKRIPKLLLSIGNKEKFDRKLDKVVKYLLGFLFSPLGLRAPEGMTSFFLKAPAFPTIRPFGVELQYGQSVGQVHYPRTAEELQSIIQQAKQNQKQVSVIGAGMSQGTQTLPINPHQVVINTQHLNKMTLSEDKQSVTVESGATWEQLQLFLNGHGKSTLVKQASDIFSIGGSIGINCHGWAHEYGAISSTVASLDIIDANGELRTLTPKDELFGCMFGTLGFFGVIVRATLKIADNDRLIEKTDEIAPEQFQNFYENNIKHRGYPLFGGRLCLDSTQGNPLRTVCMVHYEKDKEATNHGAPTENFTAEPKVGTRLERIGLQLFSNLSDFSVRGLTSWFWTQERAHMLQGRKLTRNEAIHPPIKAFKMLRRSHLHAQWLQEYFIKPENLPTFLAFLGQTLKDYNVRLLNATIRPTPQDPISILPYAEQDRYAVVICFSQRKTDKAINRTRAWMEEVNRYLISHGDRYYQAYMPFATREQFETCYGPERVATLRALKKKYDPLSLFGNVHTAKYFQETP